MDIRAALFGDVCFGGDAPHALEGVHEEDRYESAKWEPVLVSGGDSEFRLDSPKERPETEQAREEGRQEIRDQGKGTYMKVIFNAYAIFATIGLSDRKWKNRLRTA